MRPADAKQNRRPMKKPSKKKRIPPRRKPLRKRQASALELTLSSQADFDRLEARNRAMLEGMPPEVREEWDRLIEGSEDAELDPADQARLDDILEQYETPVSEAVIARHVADIVREREARRTVSEP